MIRASETNQGTSKNDSSVQCSQKVKSNEQISIIQCLHGNKEILKNVNKGSIKPITSSGLSGENVPKETCDVSSCQKSQRVISGQNLQDVSSICASGHGLQGRTNASYTGQTANTSSVGSENINSEVKTKAARQWLHAKAGSPNKSTQSLIVRSNNDTKGKSFVSTLSPKKSLMVDSMAISKRLEEAEQKIQSLKKAMSILEAGKSAATSKVERQKVAKLSESVKSSTQGSDGKTGKKFHSIRKDGDKTVPGTKPAQCYKVENMPIKKSNSITPISDLITENLRIQRGKLIPGNKDEFSSYEQSKKKELGKKVVSNKTKSNPKPQVKTKSITPISDLIDKTIQRQNAHIPSPSKVHASSITPISDLISKNIENQKSKHAENGRASTKFRKSPKYSPSISWSRRKRSYTKHSHTEERKYSGFKHVRHTSFSPLTKWNKVYRTDNENAHQSPGANSFKSPAQKLAYVIKNKYKLVKGNAANHKPVYSHTVKTRYSLKRVKTLDTRKKLKFTNRKHDYNTLFGHHWKGSRLSYRNSCAKLNNYRQKWKSGNRFRLDRRGEAKYSMPSILDGQRLVMINGTVYRTSNKGLTATNPSKHRRSSSLWKKFQSSTPKTILVRGVKFQMDANGKTLKRLQSHDGKESTKVSRVDLGGITYIQRSQGVLEQLTGSNSRAAASQVLHRSIRTATAKFRKDNTKLAQKYCKYYNRFGRCRRGDQCQYIHDPTKIAVCTRFLRGTCNITDCPFSHNVDKDKMPVCSYYLKGVCNRDNCPYLHVNVDRNAEICTDFVNGFCPLGMKCKKMHTRICPNFSRTGKCPEGNKCKLIHQSKKQRRKSSQGKSDGERQTFLGKHKQDIQDDDDEIPGKTRKLPTYISISGYTDSTAVVLGTSCQGEQGTIDESQKEPHISSQNTPETATHLDEVEGAYAIASTLASASASASALRLRKSGHLHPHPPIIPTSTKLKWMMHLTKLTTLHGTDAASDPYFMLERPG
ncbi:hypothetical protein FSP39_006927 [Pinctada imbricata]|uniref:Zinc finger CCCH domain-containing protein 3 n=1 Tax=Pinctada imbricata TaxID=66713 RepID=A0AA88XHY2_PINIB|nr:hypothetical protein FSP39_006927 [Pinctada imbricata]